MTTPLLSLDEISESQAGKALTHNAALRQLEGRLVRAKDKDLTTPPGSPAEGDTYIIPSGASGIWASKTNQIAHFFGGAWVYWTPIEGIRLWLMDEDVEYVFDGTSWGVNAGALAAHVAASDPHTAYQKESEKGAANGYASLDSGGLVPSAQLPASGAQPYVIAGFCPGVPVASQVILVHVFTDTVLFPSGLGTSKGLAQVAATASTVFDIAKWASGSWSNVGTATFAAAGTVATWAMASGQTFNAGDALKITGPASADVTIANVTFSIRGTR